MTELDSKELFEHAISDTPAPPETPAPTEPPVDAGQPRDEQGRFAAKQPDEPAPAAPVETTPPPAAAPQQQPEAQVPSWRLREVNDAREAAERRAQDFERRAQDFERQLAQLQQQARPQPEPPDVIADPQGWQSFVLQQQQAQAFSQRYQFSEMLARQAFGDDRVNDAEKWAGANVGPAERARIANSKHPYAELIRIQDERKTLSEIGTDPSAYRQKVLDDALKDPAYLAKALAAAQAQATGQTGAKPNTLVQLPPSLNRQASAASPHEEVGDLSNGSLYAFATR